MMQDQRDAIRGGRTGADLARRTRTDFLSLHAPIAGLLIRAGPPKNPRHIGRLWHVDTSPPPGSPGSPYSGAPGDVAAWSDAVDELLDDAESPGPCVRLEILNSDGRSLATWQQTAAESPASALAAHADPMAAMVMAMVQAQASLLGEHRKTLQIMNHTVDQLSTALVARDERLYSALDASYEAHRLAAQAVLDAALMVVEGTPDDEDMTSGGIEDRVLGMLSQVAQKFGLDMPSPTPGPDDRGPTDRGPTDHDPDPA